MAEARGADVLISHSAILSLPVERRAHVRGQTPATWVTPTERPSTGWMATGLALYEALRDARPELLEVYPYAGFRALAGGAPLLPKQTAEGARVRIGLLASAGVSAEHLPMWSHDGLDALLAAVVAAQFASGEAVRVTCGHDDSAIWLPQPEM